MAEIQQNVINYRFIKTGIKALTAGNLQFYVYYRNSGYLPQIRVFLINPGIYSEMSKLSGPVLTAAYTVRYMTVLSIREMETSTGTGITTTGMYFLTGTGKTTTGTGKTSNFVKTTPGTGKTTTGTSITVPGLVLLYLAQYYCIWPSITRPGPSITRPGTSTVSQAPATVSEMTLTDVFFSTTWTPILGKLTVYGATVATLGAECG